MAHETDWAGWLQMDGWGGRFQQAVYVVGETPKRYRITPGCGQKVRLGGRCRWLNPGETALVPKHAITKERAKLRGQWVAGGEQEHQTCE